MNKYERALMDIVFDMRQGMSEEWLDDERMQNNLSDIGELVKLSVEKKVRWEKASIGDGDIPNGKLTWKYPTCPRCGEDVETGHNYCWYCGQRLDWSEYDWSEYE